MRVCPSTRCIRSQPFRSPRWPIITSGGAGDMRVCSGARSIRSRPSGKLRRPSLKLVGSRYTTGCRHGKRYNGVHKNLETELRHLLDFWTPFPQEVVVESDSFIYLKRTLPSVKPICGTLRNQLGDFAVVLTGVSDHLTVRQRRLKRYFDGLQHRSGRDHRRWFGAKTSDRIWQDFWAGWLHSTKTRA